MPLKVKQFRCYGDCRGTLYCLLFPHLGCLGEGDNYSDSGGTQLVLDALNQALDAQSFIRKPYFLEYWKKILVNVRSQIFFCIVTLT